MPTPSSLLEAAGCGDVQRVSLFLQSINLQDAHPDNTDGTQSNQLFEVDRQGYSAAAWACCQDDLSVLELLLTASPKFLSIVTHHGASLLHLTCLHKSLRCLDHLLAHVFTQDSPQLLRLLDATNHFQETAMHLAAGIGHTQTVRRLIEAGAACVRTDQYGRSPHTVATQNGYSACAAMIMAHLTAEEKTLLKQEEEAQLLEHQHTSAGDTSAGDTVPETETETASGLNLQQVQLLQAELRLHPPLLRAAAGGRAAQEQHLFKHLVRANPPGSEEEAPFPPPPPPPVPVSVPVSVGVGSTSTSTTNISTSPLPAPLPSSTSTSSPVCTRTALSKLVEFPGDLAAVRLLLQQSQLQSQTSLQTQTPLQSASEFPIVTVDPAGRDMFGLTALHKFAAWNKPDLLQLLLPHLTAAELNASGGSEGFSALHHCVDMHAPQALHFLLGAAAAAGRGAPAGGIDPGVKDMKGRTYRELAHELGYSSLLEDC